MNPAGLPGVRARTIAVSVSPAPLGLAELRRAAFAYVEPFGVFTASVAGIRYGYDLYREITLGASVGLDCGRGVRAGGSVTLNSLSIAGYAHGSCAGIDAGVLWEIAPVLQLGATALNWNAPSPGRSHEEIPRSVQAGIAYRPATGFLLACDVAEESRFPAGLMLGAELIVADVLSLRAGISTDPSACSAGLGLLLLPVDFEYAFTRHQELGSSHRFGLSVRLGGW
jgi:hypothetical protein